MVNTTVWFHKPEQLNDFEAQQRQELIRHPAFRRLQDKDLMPRQELEQLLIQRRFFSLAFTPVADIVENGLTDRDHKSVIHELIREEYMDKEISHRAALMHDLNLLGISRFIIMETDPSQNTLDCLQRTFQLLKPNGDSEVQYQVRLLSAMRFWGEVLVAAEYEQYVVRLSAEGLVKEQSLFYYEHIAHDRPLYGFNVPGLANSGNHADKLTYLLQEMFEFYQDSSLINHCANVSHAVLEIKSSFYDQFA